jgi:hypothetical protein
MSAPQPIKLTQRSSKLGVFVLFIVLVCLITLVSIALRMPARSQAEPEKTTPFNTGNPTAERLLNMSAEAQRYVLAQDVPGCTANQTFYMGRDRDHDAFFSIWCSDGGSYEIMIRPDSEGSSKVLECATLEAVAQVKCFEKLPPP